MDFLTIVQLQTTRLFPQFHPFLWPTFDFAPIYWIGFKLISKNSKDFFSSNVGIFFSCFAPNS